MFKATFKNFVKGFANMAKPSYYRLNSEYYYTGLVGGKKAYLLLLKQSTVVKSKALNALETNVLFLPPILLFSKSFHCLSSRKELR